MAKQPVTLSSRSVSLDDTRKWIGARHDRIRDPRLTVLLVLELCAIFIAAPAVIGQFYLAITVARLVTLELEDRRRRPPSSSRRYAHASVIILNRHMARIDGDLAEFE